MIIMSKVQVFGATDCKDTDRVREHLRAAAVGHDFIDINKDPSAEQQVKEWNGGKRKTPTLIFAGTERQQEPLSVPSDAELDVWLDSLGLLGSQVGDGYSGSAPQTAKATPTPGRQPLGFSVVLTDSFEDVTEHTKEALKAEGFGVLSEIAIHKALKDKLGVDVPRQMILGACNPHLAHEALQIEPDVSLFLPCNVVVRESESGVTVSAVDAEQMLGAVHRPELAAIAGQANEKLRNVITALALKKAA
ncbi:MAG: hypothetical protein NVS1B11_35360 [Terriglobales bacterium]